MNKGAVSLEYYRHFCYAVDVVKHLHGGMEQSRTCIIDRQANSEVQAAVSNIFVWIQILTEFEVDSMTSKWLRQDLDNTRHPNTYLMGHRKHCMLYTIPSAPSPFTNLVSSLSSINKQFQYRVFQESKRNIFSATECDSHHPANPLYPSLPSLL